MASLDKHTPDTAGEIENVSASAPEVAHDKDIVGGDGPTKKTKNQAMHFQRLTEEELVLEKKLRRRIDSIVLPMVVVVCLQFSVCS